MEWKGQDAFCTLIIRVERGGAAERCEQRIAGKCARRQVQKSFCELKGFCPFVSIESKHEVGLYVRYVAQDQIDVFGYLADFIHPPLCAGLGLVAHVEPRLN